MARLVRLHRALSGGNRAGGSEEPGQRNGWIWLNGTGALNTSGTLSAARSSTAPLTGGDISVPHKGAKK